MIVVWLLQRVWCLISYIIVCLRVSVLRVGAVCEGRVFVRGRFFLSVARMRVRTRILPPFLSTPVSVCLWCNRKSWEVRQKEATLDQRGSISKTFYSPLLYLSILSPRSLQQGVATDCSPCTAVGKSAVRILRKTFLRVRCFIDRCLPGRKRCGPRTCSMLNRRVTALAVSISTWRVHMGCVHPIL